LVSCFFFYFKLSSYFTRHTQEKKSPVCFSGLQFRKQEHREDLYLILSLFSLGVSPLFDDTLGINILKKRKKEGKRHLLIVQYFPDLMQPSSSSGVVN